MLEQIEKYLKKLIKILSLKELRILPAYLAYSFVLAIIPIITIMAIIAGYFSISMDSVINLLNDLLPSYASKVVIGAISGKDFDLSIGILNIITFIIAANGMYAIVDASNSLYKIEETSQIKDRFKSVIILFAIIAVLLFLILVPMMGDRILELFGKYEILDNVLNELISLYHIVKWPLTFVIIFLDVRLIYSIAPSKKLENHSTTVGALITTVLWVGFTAIFGSYIKYFARYDLLYGSLSSIIIFLIWIYTLSIILIFGIVVNSTMYSRNN